MKGVSPEHMHPGFLSLVCESIDGEGAGICDARKTFEHTQRELKGLWRGWAKLQQKIACLSIEVIGVAQFADRASENVGVRKRRLDVAVSTSKENQGAEEYARSVVQAHCEEIQNSARESISRLSSQSEVRFIPTAEVLLTI